MSEQCDDAGEASAAVGHRSPVATTRLSTILQRLPSHPETQRRVQELKALDNCRNRRYVWKRRQRDPMFAVIQAVKGRIRAALLSKRRVDRYNGLIGCTPKQLKAHLEKQFRHGMSWLNYGQWEVDHIRPCRSYDLSKPHQQWDCFNFSNLQPLWRSENRSKSGKWSGSNTRYRKRPKVKTHRETEESWRKKVGMAEQRHAKVWSESIEARTAVVVSGEVSQQQENESDLC